MAKKTMFSHRHSHIIIILLSVLVGLGIAAMVMYSPATHEQITPPASAQGIANLEDGFVEVVARVRPAVVNITAERLQKRTMATMPEIPPQLREFFEQFRGPFGMPEGDPGEEEAIPTPVAGSGWIYREDGYIVTNTHVVRDGTNFQIQLFDKDDDRKYDAKLIGKDPKTDLAILKIDVDRKLPTLSLGSSAEARVGQWVMAIGSPFHLDQTVTAGIISAKGRSLPGLSTYIQLGDIIQTDAAINLGNSGGPLVNVRGEVIGINVAIFSPGMTPGNVGIGFAIPSDAARRVIPQLIEHKVVRRGWLGISLALELTANIRDFYGVDHGALVTNIQEDSPATDSDLQVEDVITAVNGQPVKDTWELQQAIGNSPPGITVELTVVRNKKERTVTVTLGEMPAMFAGLEEPEEPEEERPAQASTALGVTVRRVTAQDKGDFDDRNLAGVVVTDVDARSPARGKLTKGDVISKVNQTSIKGLTDWENALQAAQDNDKSYIVLHVVRKVDGDILHSIVDISVEW